MALLIAGAAFQREPWALPALVLPGFLCMAAGMVSSPAIQSMIAESAEPRRRVSAYATATFFWVLPGALLAIPLGLASDRLGYGAVFGVALGLESANLVLFARFLRETALRADVERLQRSAGEIEVKLARAREKLLSEIAAVNLTMQAFADSRQKKLPLILNENIIGDTQGLAPDQSYINSLIPG